MALTIGNLVYANSGGSWEVTGTIAFDSSYPTGGETLTAANVGMAQLDSINVYPRLGLIFEYDYTNELLLVYEQGVTTGSTTGTADNAPSGTYTSALVEDSAQAETSVATSIISTADTTYRTGRMVQVADTTDLSSVSGVRFRALGV